MELLPIPKDLVNIWKDKYNLSVYSNGILLTMGADCDYEITKGNDIEFKMKIRVHSIINLILMEGNFPKYVYEFIGPRNWKCIAKPNKQTNVIPVGQIFKMSPPKYVGKFQKRKDYKIEKTFYFDMPDFKFNDSVEEPKNNDGRQNCFWCGAPTKKSPGYSAMYDICTNCGK